MLNSFAPQIPRNPRNDRMLASIKEAALEYENKKIESLPFSKYRIYFETGSRVQYEACYIEHRRRLNVYTAMALSSEEKIWVTGLEDILWAVCDEFTWAFPAHIKDWNDISDSSITVDLFACETGLALSEICYLLGERLSMTVRRRVETEIRRRLIRPYTERHLTFHKDNWSAVCAGCIAMAVMYWGSPEEYEVIEAKVMGSMEDFLGSYQDDGCCLEGALYWGYGFGYFCYFARMLREYTQGKKDLFRLDKVKQIALFCQTIYLEKNIVVPFADAPHNYSCHVGLMHFLAQEYEEAEVQDEAWGAVFDEDIRHRFADFIRDFFWYVPSLEKKGKKKEVTIYRQSQWYLKRNQKYFFAAKGGRNNEPHNHNDLGSFILFSEGKFIIDDLGWPEYDRDYFGEKRYENICASSAGHSVPVLNGFLQERGRMHVSEMILAGECQVAYDLRGAYSEGVSRVFTRQFLMEENGISMRDTIEGVSGQIRERFVTRILPEVRETEVVISGWSIRCRREAVAVAVEKREFQPRLSICKMDMKPVETAYLIDFVLESCGQREELDFTLHKLL